MNIKQLIAYKISDARNYLGLTQQDLGDKLGVGKNTVSQWERGVRGVSIENIEAIAAATNKPITWFFHSPESAPAPATVNFEPDSTLHNQKININNQMTQKDNTIGEYKTIHPGATMIHGDRSSEINITEELTQHMTEKMENCNQQIKEMAGQISELAIAVKLMAEIIEKNQKNNEAQNALLLEILKNAQENERLAEVNYLLEVGEISATEARLRMRNPDNYK